MVEMGVFRLWGDAQVKLNEQTLISMSFYDPFLILQYKYKPYSETTENSRHYKFIAKAFKIYPKMQNFQMHRSIQDHLEKKHY
jgi:hypothetical protein